MSCLLLCSSRVVYYRDWALSFSVLFNPHFCFFVFLVPITDEELLTLSKNLHINDVNGVIVELDLQAKTTIGDLTDKAPGR